MMLSWMLLLADVGVDSAVPQWVSALSWPALGGVLLYYMITVAMPRTQKDFHEELAKERASHEKTLEKTIQEFRDANKAILERGDRQHDQLVGKIDVLANQLRSAV